MERGAAAPTRGTGRAARVVHTTPGGVAAGAKGPGACKGLQWVAESCVSPVWCCKLSGGWNARRTLRAVSMMGRLGPDVGMAEMHAYSNCA